MTGSVSVFKRDDLLTRLTEEQRTRGYLSEEFLASLAQSLGISVGEVYGVATFYAFLSVTPQGKHVIRACRSVPCHLKGSEKVASWIADYLEIGDGETTPDGRFTFELINCLGACDQGPAMLIDDRVYGDLNREKVADILKSFD